MPLILASKGLVWAGRRILGLPFVLPQPPSSPCMAWIKGLTNLPLVVNQKGGLDYDLQHGDSLSKSKERREINRALRFLHQDKYKGDMVAEALRVSLMKLLIHRRERVGKTMGKTYSFFVLYVDSDGTTYDKPPPPPTQPLSPSPSPLVSLLLPPLSRLLSVFLWLLRLRLLPLSLRLYFLPPVLRLHRLVNTKQSSYPPASHFPLYTPSRTQKLSIDLFPSHSRGFYSTSRLMIPSLPIVFILVSCLCSTAHAAPPASSFDPSAVFKTFTSLLWEKGLEWNKLPPLITRMAEEYSRPLGITPEGLLMGLLSMIGALSNGCRG